MQPGAWSKHASVCAGKRKNDNPCEVRSPRKGRYGSKNWLLSPGALAVGEALGQAGDEKRKVVGLRLAGRWGLSVQVREEIPKEAFGGCALRPIDAGKVSGNCTGDGATGIMIIDGDVMGRGRQSCPRRDDGRCLSLFAWQQR